MLVGFKNIDSHFIFYLFGLIIKIRHKFDRLNIRKVKEYGINTELRKEKIIVSLTTFPERINKVHLTIEQLLTQTMKPDKLILWLAEEQFPNEEKDLPESLLRLKEYGLTISWCEDLKSYKKLLPTLKEYPNDIIITYDDDIYYNEDSIENLYKAHLEETQCICTHRFSKVYFREKNLNFYKSRQLYFIKKVKKISYFNTIVGCGGVLYPSGSLYKEINNIDLIRKTIPSHDDVWFWAMAVLNGTKIKVVDGFSRSLPTVENTQQYGLCKKNNIKNSGLSYNQALEIIISNFPEIINILKGEYNE